VDLSAAMSSLVINGEMVQGEAQARAAIEMQAYSVDPHAVAEPEDFDVDERTGLPKVMKSYLIHDDPKMHIIPRFLSDAEIDHLLELVEPHWVPSVVGSGTYTENNDESDLKNKGSQNRTSNSSMLRVAQTPIVREVESRISHVAGISVDHLENLNLVRYAPGQFFNKHHDGHFRPKTVFIYLNDCVNDNGETFFPELGLKIVPRKGSAVMWSNILSHQVGDMRMVHYGLPPSTITKFGINCFFNEKAIREWYDIDSDEDNHDQGSAKPAGDKYHTIDAAELAEGEGHSPGVVLNVLVVRDPKLIVAPNFLSPAEAQSLIKCVDPQNKSTAEDAIMFSAVRSRCSVLANLPESHMEAFQIGKCGPTDAPSGRANANGRMSDKYGCKTIYIFLNEVEGRGDLRFPRLLVQVKPREGCAVVWSTIMEDGQDDARIVHQCRPPKTGTRFGITCVFRAHPVR